MPIPVDKDTPLSESTIPIKLADVRRRCAELLEDDRELSALSLEEPLDAEDLERHNIPR